MEKITISRIGIEKTINYVNKKTGKPDSFKKIGVQTNEYGDRWYDITFRGEVPVKVGQSYEVETSEREYDGKTYYDAKLPQERRSQAGGMTEEQYRSIMRQMQAINANVLRVLSFVDPDAKLTSLGTKVPDFSEVNEERIADPATDPEFDPFAGMQTT